MNHNSFKERAKEYICSWIANEDYDRYFLTTMFLSFLLLLMFSLFREKNEMNIYSGLICFITIIIWIISLIKFYISSKLNETEQNHILIILSKILILIIGIPSNAFFIYALYIGNFNKF